MAKQPGPRGYSDQTLRDRTGRSSEEWYAILDAFDVKANGHAAAARLLQQRYGLNGWWAQMVSARYEWTRGLRTDDVPPHPSLKLALDNHPVLAAAFARLTAYQQGRASAWIAEAQREETRARRVERTLTALRKGGRHPAI